jgi:CheY-like chemotaxis protein
MSALEKFSTLQALLVEDNPIDVFMTKQASEESEFNVALHVVEDGDEAIDFLHQNCYTRDTDIPCPDLILLGRGKAVLK